MKLFYTILFLVAFFSCTRKYHITNDFRKGVPVEMQQIKIDHTYQLFIREGFLDTTEQRDKKMIAKINANRSEDKIIEIEYLLFSADSNRAIYFATIPDKFLTYYAKKSKYLPREYLNAYDFSTFHFGKKVENESTLVFDNKPAYKSITWKYSFEKDSIFSINEIVETKKTTIVSTYNIDEALNNKANFVSLDSFKIAFRNMDKEKKVETKKGRPPLQRTSLDNIIYFNEHNNKFNIYFRFNKSLPNRYKDSTIKFNNVRLINPPH